MTDQHPENAARKAWSSQPDDLVGVDLTRARQTGAARQAEVRKRDRIAYLCALIIAPSWAAAMWFMPDLRLVAAACFVVAVWVPSFVYWRSGARLTPDTYATCVSFQQALLQREIAFRVAMPRWYMLPIALSQAAIFFGLFTSPRFPQTAMLFWGAAAMMVTAFGVLAVARKRLMREASELRRELSLLNAAAGGDILSASKG
jgi:hypothetical protein